MPVEPETHRRTSHRRVIIDVVAIALVLLVGWLSYRYFGPIRHDPQEQDAVKGPIIRRVLDESTAQATAEFDQKFGGHRMGMCHRVWHVAKMRLREEYQIDWR